jgi:ATP-dependent Lon protease
MKFKKLLLLIVISFCTLSSNEQSVLGTGANVDIITALQPINLHLRKLLMQQSKDYTLFEKMDGYQKKLDAVNDIKDVVLNMKAAIEIATLIDNIVCVSKNYYNHLDKYEEKKMDFCQFNFKQQFAFSRLTMGMELYATTFSTQKISTSERIKMLEKAKESLVKSKDLLQELTNILIYA